jgi:hypothetical protein
MLEPEPLSMLDLNHHPTRGEWIYHSELKRAYVCAIDGRWSNLDYVHSLDEARAGAAQLLDLHPTPSAT